MEQDTGVSRSRERSFQRKSPSLTVPTYLPSRLMTGDGGVAVVVHLLQPLPEGAVVIQVATELFGSKK